MTWRDWLGLSADVLGIFAAIITLIGFPYFFIFIKKWRQRKIQALNPEPGSRSAVLAIGLGSRAVMEEQVRVYIESQPELLKQLGGELKKDANFYLLEKREDLPEPKLGGKESAELYDEEADKYVSEVIDALDKEMIRMANGGISRVHLFYQGPVILSAVVGAALGNRFTVLCYHRSKAAASYYSVGPMKNR